MKKYAFKFFIVFVFGTVMFFCKEEKTKYKHSFFNDVDKVEHLEFKNENLFKKNGENRELEIISKTIVPKENFEELFVFISTDYSKDCKYMKCVYNPRDVIYFYKKGKKLGYYEFCKQCGGSRTSKNLDSLPAFCVNNVLKIEKILKVN